MYYDRLFRTKVIIYRNGIEYDEFNRPTQALKKVGQTRVHYKKNTNIIIQQEPQMRSTEQFTFYFKTRVDIRETDVVEVVNSGEYFVMKSNPFRQKTYIELEAERLSEVGDTNV